ncbi:hypothetical protein EV361DRAFT_955508 [Lentinula raphanica]|uniref:Ubiquitin-like protease family profile domain-containing protein n=1 Tax=Lentinula raphanica TaxID=153919 RepID=A0AA38NW51_9AGAR|nr:hypothetical protein F5878DRAFT_667371 [Lentinula raphanica]KAJ3964910.1 hypothetical protein EV361DRAFT_955508 [Lentinula raphanica]
MSRNDEDRAAVVPSITILSRTISTTSSDSSFPKLEILAQNIRRWFVEARISLPSSSAEPLPPSEVDKWVEEINLVYGQRAEQHWANLVSGNLESYLLSMREQKQLHHLEEFRKQLAQEFQDVAVLCDAHGYSSLSSAIRDQQRIFRRVSLEFIAMNQGVERTTHSWRDTHPQTAVVLLEQVRLEYYQTMNLKSYIGFQPFQFVSLLKSKSGCYQIPRSLWNDGHIIRPSDLDAMLAMKWLNSSLIDAFISKLNVKFSGPHQHRNVAFFETSFATHYVYPGTKPHHTLTNAQGSMKYRPLKALRDRFTDGNVTLICPVNASNTHWFIVALCAGDSFTVNVMDSLHGSGPVFPPYLTAYENLKILWKTILMTWFKGSEIEDREWKLVVHSDIPRQRNNSDCGVFALMYMMHLGYGPRINNECVPISYRLPEASDDLAGIRLLLLEELLLEHVDLN